MVRQERSRPMRAQRVLDKLVDQFEARGVYVPGEDNKAISPWRDFGWLIALWLVTVAVLILFFAMAA
jgi:hypothetical protein